jgi:hypothetical protein
LGAAYQTYITPRWGVKISAGYGDNDGQNPFIEKDISLKGLARW